MPNRRRNPKQKKKKKKNGHITRTKDQAKARRKAKRPTTVKQYFSMSEKEQETWDSVAHVITRMRDRISRTKASKEFGVEPSLVIDLGRPALRKKNGRYVATKTDRLLRVLTVVGSKGKKTIATRDSRQASLVGEHWAAVQKYLQIGDDSALLKFKKKSVTDANGRRHRLLTNLKELDRLGSFGALRFESIYAGSAR